MTLPTHHPDEALLFGYAGGSLNEASALVLATHMTYCPNCREAVADLEVVGGALLDGLDPEPVDDGLLESLLARIDAEPAPAPPPVPARPAARAARPDTVVPEPLRRYVGDDLSRLEWQTALPGVRLAPVAMTGADDGSRVQLMRMEGGRTIPRHGHDGMELVVVLEGGFSDEHGSYRTGDVAILHTGSEHAPRAHAEGCLCLAVNMERSAMTGPMDCFLGLMMAR